MSFFKTSHKAGVTLKKLTKEFGIEGSGLKTYTPTR